MQLNRRQLLIAGAGLVAATLHTGNAQTQNSSNIQSAPLGSSDEAWKEIQNLYKVDRNLVNLENGYWGAMPQPILNEYIKNTEFINFYNTGYARSDWGQDFDLIRQQVADAVGADISEIALTRGATEALQKLLAGYNLLQPDDVIAYSDLDYDSMQYVMDWLVKVRGVKLKKIVIPEPVTKENVIATYQELLKTPKLKLLLLTHLSHRTGLVMPIAEISTMAKEKNIDTIVDAAHSWGQIDFNVKDLNSDFVGFNLHKWISAPVGVGFLYINKDRIGAITPDYDDQDYAQDDIRGRIHTGTQNFAALMTVPTAIQLHETISAKAKQERLTYLRNLWVAGLEDNPKIEILTPNDTTMHAGITAFRFNNLRDKKGNNELVKTLKEQHGLQLVRRGGIAKGDAIRVSPALYTMDEDIYHLINTMNSLS